MRFFPNLENNYRLFISAQTRSSSPEDEIIFKQDMDRLAQFFTNISKNALLDLDSVKLAELNRILRPYRGLKTRRFQKPLKVASSQ